MNGVVVDVQTVKQEDVYLKAYETVPGLQAGLKAYFAFYNERRLHQSLGYQAPAEVYRRSRRAA